MNQLTRDAARRALPAILNRLGSENARSLRAISERLHEDGRANLGEVLRHLYPKLDAQAAQAKLRQLRLAIGKAAEKLPAIEFALDGDTQTRSVPDDRWIWFAGDDPLAQYHNVGEPLHGWIDIDAEPLYPKCCHLLYAEKDRPEALRFAEILKPHLESREVDLWTPECILPGEQADDATRLSEQTCFFALALISPEFQADPASQAALLRLGRRSIPIALHNTSLGGGQKVFRHDGKSFGEVRNKREWVLQLIETLRPILESNARIRVPLPAPERDFVAGEAEPLSLERAVLSATALTNEALREYRGHSALDSLLRWMLDPKSPPYCALLGELGMGKTTTAKELTRRAPGVRFYFDLRNVRELAKRGDDCPGLRVILASLLEKQPWESAPGFRPPTVDDVITHVANGALVIFDGLDEVLVNISPGRGQAFTRQLFSLVPARKDTRGRLLITCRSHYFRTITEQSAHFTTEDRDGVTAKSYAAFVLLPFREEQIREYLKLTLGEAEGPRAFDLISSVHNLPELAERPYTLNLIRRQFGRLEQAKATGSSVTGFTLYQFFVDEWLVRDQGKHQFRMDDKKLLMEELAAELARAGQRSWTARQLERWLAALAARQPEFQAYTYRQVESALLEQDLRNATFLVREGDGFRFAHSSLQEYFLAAYLRRALEEGRPEAWALPGVSRETLDFLGQGLLESPSEAALAGLRQLRDRFRAGASELALRYFVLAFAKRYPCPAANGFQLGGANLWEFAADFGDEGDRFDLSGASFAGARMGNSYWRGCRLQGCDFMGAEAEEAEWHRCDLRESRWADAELRGALWRQCDLREAADLGSAARAVLCEGRSLTPPINGQLALALQTGHLGAVNGVAWSPDGRRLASGADDHMVKLWDTGTGECVRTLAGHRSSVTSVAWSSDGRRLASGCEETLKLWDTATGECVRTLAGHTSFVRSVAWSPDGQRLASGSYEGTLKLWDTGTGECVRTLAGHLNLVRSVAWSPDGRRLTSWSDDYMVKLWDAGTGECVRTVAWHTDSARSVALSPDGQRLASGSYEGTLKLWDTATGECVRTLTGHRSSVTSVAWSPDGRRLVSGSDDHTVKLWDTGTGECMRTLAGHSGSVTSVAWSPDGRRLASGGEGTVKLWDLSTGESVRTMAGHTCSVPSVAWSPDGRRLASGGEGPPKLWDLSTGESVRTLAGHTRFVTSVAWSPDGRRLASGSTKGTVTLWDLSTGECVRTLAGHIHAVWSVAWSPDGRRLASGSFDDAVNLWDTGTGECLRKMDGYDEVVGSVAWSPGGRHLASGSLDHLVNLWDTGTGKHVQTLAGHSEPVSSVTWSPDGRRLASGSDDYTILLWDTGAGKSVQALEGHSNAVLSVAWSPDGRRVASGSADRTLKLWDVSTGDCLRTMDGHSNAVLSVAWSPDGRRLASGSDDGTIILWDVETGEEIQPRRYHIDVRHGAPSWAAVDLVANRVVACGPGAWQFIRWRVPGSDELLPAEAFGPLPERAD